MENFDKLIVYLDIIGGLKENDTISTTNFEIVKRDSWYRKYQKYVYKDSRQKTIAWIEEIVNKSIYIIDYCDIEFNLFDKIQKSLYKCLSGLNELYKTYFDDDMVQEKVVFLQEKIKKRFSEKTNISLYGTIVDLTQNIHIRKIKETQHDIQNDVMINYLD